MLIALMTSKTVISPVFNFLKLKNVKDFYKQELDNSIVPPGAIFIERNID